LGESGKLISRRKTLRPSVLSSALMLLLEYLLQVKENGTGHRSLHQDFNHVLLARIPFFTYSAACACALMKAHMKVDKGEKLQMHFVGCRYRVEGQIDFIKL
jgi:hypothetical protein